MTVIPADSMKDFREDAFASPMFPMNMLLSDAI